MHVLDKGCKKHGVYGSGCDKPCPDNCEYNLCHIQSGCCFACASGWTGTSCNTSMMMATM